MKLTDSVSSCDTLSSVDKIEMSKFPNVFKKRNTAAGGKGPTSAGSANALSSASAKDAITGWSDLDLQKRRLMAFVRGIQVSGNGLYAALCNDVNEFNINVDTFDYDNLTFDLHRVSQNGLVNVGMDHEMTECGNHVKITYAIEKPGQYEMDIKYLGLPIPMSPFKIEVHDGDAVNVKDVVAYGKGLKRCLAGDVTTFQVETKKSGYGKISVAVDGQVEVPVYVTESKSGYKVQYIATSTGSFFFRIKINGKHIPGSPFLVKAEKKREIPETAKKFFKKGVNNGSKENRNDLNLITCP